MILVIYTGIKLQFNKRYRKMAAILTFGVATEDVVENMVTFVFVINTSKIVKLSNKNLFGTEIDRST